MTRDAARPWVVKIGGQELRSGSPVEGLARRLAAAASDGRPLVVVHGGGDEVTARAEALGLPTQRVRGQRVTDAAMLEVVQEVLAGRINARVVVALQRAGRAALGVSGLSDRLLEAVPAGEPPGSLGFVGRPTSVNAARLRQWLDAELTPVLAPLALGPGGTVLNVNADLAAGAVAASLRADLSLLTDVPAVRDGSGAPVAALHLDQLPAFVAGGAVRDGMLPKLEGAAEALRGGAASVWIGDLEGLSAPGSNVRTGTRLLPARPAPLPLPPRRGSAR